MANAKFDRALKEGDLSEFPNVTFFQKKRQAELERLNQVIQMAEHEDAKIACRERITKLENDLKIIETFLKKDLRLTKFVNSEGTHQLTVENIEQQEDKKLYHEWVESQQKLNCSQKEETDPNSHKQELFKEIQNLIQQTKIENQLSYFERVQKQKSEMLKLHTDIGKSGQIKKAIFQKFEMLDEKKIVNKYIAKAHPSLNL